MNCPPLLLTLPRDQRVRIPVSVRARSFPATIRETSSRRNRHLYYRGSNNDSDHGCKISTLPGHFLLVVKNRSEAAARALHSPPQLSRSRSRNGSERHSLGLSSPSSPCPKNVNQLTIYIIGYILSQMPASCRRGDKEAGGNLDKRGSPRMVFVWTLGAAMRLH